MGWGGALPILMGLSIGTLNMPVPNATFMTSNRRKQKTRGKIITVDVQKASDDLRLCKIPLKREGMS